MANLGRFGDILGIFILPFVAILMLVLSPLLIVLMWWNNRGEE